MKIAIMAAGAVGGYFGARLAGAGHEVHFLARGKHLEAIRAGGLRVKSDFGDMHLTSVSVSDDPSQVGPVDVILFAVKLWDTAAAARAASPLAFAADEEFLPVAAGRLDAVVPAVPVVDAVGPVASVVDAAEECRTWRAWTPTATDDSAWTRLRSH